jgi:hypothetical protein
VATLDAAEAAALTNYVSEGGSVVFFAGEATRADFVNESLYRDGKGFFPLPLASPASLIVDRLDKTPDIEVDVRHPIMSRTFAGSRHSMLRTLYVDRYFAAPKDWTPSAENGVRVLANLRNKAPLIVERKFGKGTCMAFLTPPSGWSNLGSEVLFVIMMQDMHAYLTTRQSAHSDQMVGTPLTLDLDKKQYAAEVQFVRPVQGATQRETVHAAEKGKSESLTVTLNNTHERGVYEARLAKLDGGKETRRFAANVPQGEGDLAIVSPDELRASLAGLNAGIHESSDFAGSVTQQAGLNLGTHWMFFAIILGLLAGEQVLAYSCSYHPNHKQPAGAHGGARGGLR